MMMMMMMITKRICPNNMALQGWQLLANSPYITAKVTKCANVD